MVEEDATVDDTRVDDTTGEDDTGEDATGTADDDAAAALDEAGADGVVSSGGADSPDSRVEVTVWPLARVFVRVIVEVEYSVVVGSEPGAPASRAASDAIGRERKAEMSRRRMIANDTRVSNTLRISAGSKRPVSWALVTGSNRHTIWKTN
ncbi:MAG: hypothetical protein L6R39_002382 [Caloplaca ligustica]|nr:MAG: hypothetical protein L6R39_002382 [Caloplaca ligustica]